MKDTKIKVHEGEKASSFAIDFLIYDACTVGLLTSETFLEKAVMWRNCQYAICQPFQLLQAEHWMEHRRRMFSLAACSAASPRL